MTIANKKQASKVEAKIEIDRFCEIHLKEIVLSPENNSWEVEALDPDTLQEILRTSIDSVLDTASFNAEIDAERDDAVHLQFVRKVIHVIISNVNGELLV